MIQQRKVEDISEVVSGLETVLKRISDASDAAPIKKAINVLRQAVTVEVGEKQITFLSNDLVGFKFYDDYQPVTTLIKSEIEEEFDREKYVDTKTVADYYGVTSETVRNWIKQKAISGHQMGPRGKFLIPKEEFEFMKAKREYKKDEIDAALKDVFGTGFDESWEIEIDE